MNSTISTPDGPLKRATLARRVVSGLTDIFSLLFVSNAIVILCVYLINDESLSLPLSVGIFGIACAFYFVRFKFGIRSPGEWGLGLLRFQYADLTEYQGKGSLWCIENVEPAEFSKRTIILVVILIVSYLTMVI